MDQVQSYYIPDQQFYDITVAESEVKYNEYETCIFRNCEYRECEFINFTFIDCQFFDCNFKVQK